MSLLAYGLPEKHEIRAVNPAVPGRATASANLQIIPVRKRKIF